MAAAAAQARSSRSTAAPLPAEERPTEDDTSPPLHREGRFRRLWTVGLVSSLIRWIDVLAFSLVTYQQTKSAFWVASMMMLRMLPQAVFGIVFGAVATRFSRRGVLLWCHAGLMAAALVLLLLSLLDRLEVWHLAIAALASGVVWSGDMPMRRGFIGDVVGPARMGQAMALDAAANNGARLGGPTLGGLLLAWGGMPAVMVADVLLYAVVIAALLGLPRPVPVARAAGSPRAALSAVIGGFGVLREMPLLKAILCNTMIFNVFCWPMLSMVPVIAQERLALGTEGTGVLASMDGLGSLLGALALTAVSHRLRNGPVYIAGTLVFLAMLPLFALSTPPLLTALLLVAMGAGQGAFAVMQSTLVFVAAPPAQRAAAMGMVTTCIGIGPVGFVMVGWLAEHLGAPGAAMACAAGGFLAMALTWQVWKPCVARDAALAPA